MLELMAVSAAYLPAIFAGVCLLTTTPRRWIAGAGAGTAPVFIVMIVISTAQGHMDPEFFQGMATVAFLNMASIAMFYLLAIERERAHTTNEEKEKVPA